MSVDFATQRLAISLEEVALRYTTLTKSNGPCPICHGGENRFYIMKCGFKWGCRICGIKGADVFDLVSRVEGITIREAAIRLTSGVFTTARPRATPAPRKVEHLWHSPQWQAEARAAIASGQEGLTPASPQFAYMRSRGLTRATLEAFQIGAAMKGGRHAVLIPWLDRKGVCSAIKYRFTDEGERFTQKQNSGPVLFGAHLVIGEHQTLAIVEGEINCLSISQAVKADVLSVGPEGNSQGLKFLPALIARHQYQHVVCWFDKGDRAREVAKALPGSIPMKSPEGKDANDVLLACGEPGLTRLIGFVIRTTNQKETP